MYAPSLRVTTRVPDAGYPTELTNKQGKKVCIVTAWQYANTVGRLNVRFDENGDVTSCKGGPVFLIDAAANWNWKNGTTTVALSDCDKTKVVKSLDADYYVQTVQNPNASQWISDNK